MRLLILYEELAPYFLHNIEKFADVYEIPVLIVSKSINPVAPFDFQTSSKHITIIRREDYSLSQLVSISKEFQPTCIMQAGWIYPPYFDLLKALKVPCNVLLMDNQWHGNIRQYLGSIYFRWKYKSLFQKAFVPGEKQKQFARHIGFGDKHIIKGFYCCDTAMFEKVFVERKRNGFRRHYTFLYVGRYAEEKNVEMLWQAFAEVCKEYPNQWQLLCVGKGNIVPFQHPQIKHLGFIQPWQLPEIITQSDVFVLQSKFEPYGVVIHEMATAGLPIISSSVVGANEYFVESDKNGYIFEFHNKYKFKEYLIKMMRQSDEEYVRMCEHSHQLSQKITTDKWIKKIYDICRI
ncbi:MAG: hypothetical protein KatS3mg028_0638 [Bacteroidia bacterium]|nr:MAG: hypothetical protein KatS3mg028_0638 [Bacteroidia bacterium]